MEGGIRGTGEGRLSRVHVRQSGGAFRDDEHVCRLLSISCVCKQARGPHEHVSLMIVHAKPSSPGMEEKLTNVEARELEFVCKCVCEKMDITVIYLNMQ